MTIEAFNLADKFQLPVFISSDLYLSERNESLESLKIENINIDRGKLLSEIPSGGYRRFADTPNGVSPRILPGTANAEYVAATDEHDEDGITISDLFTNPAIRAKMMRKRMRKLEFVLQEIAPPELEGPKDAKITLVGWGSTYSVLLEAQQELARQSIPVNIFAPRYLFPFHANAAKQLLDSCALTLAVEANYTGQLARLIKMETGFSIHHHLHKYDGEPFEPSQVIEHVKKLLKEKPEFKTIESVTSSEGISADFSPLRSGHA
jgi:2-oxoglutarate ferredoxin oxidoreductase subunit alpha